MKRRFFSRLFFPVAFICSTGLCLAGENRIVLKGPSPGTKAFVVGDVLVTDPANNSVKPSMTSAPNGDLYVAVEDLDSDWLQVYRSTDGGSSWARFVGFGSLENARNPSVAYGEHTGGEKWLYVAYEWVAADDDSRWVTVFRVAPDGSNPTFSNIDGPYLMNGVDDQVHPQIITDFASRGDSYNVYVTYPTFSLDGYPVYFSRSLDRGDTWEPPLEVSGASLFTGWSTRPEIAYGNPAGLYVTFVKPGWNGATNTNQIWLTRSTDAGASFSPPVQITSHVQNVYHPSVAVADGTDTLLVAYTVDWGSDTDVEVLVSTNGGTVWTPGDLPWTFDHESSVDLAVSNLSGRFHAAYKHETFVGLTDTVWYSQASIAAPGDWSPAAKINQGDTAASISSYPRPTIAVVPGLPAGGDAAVAWTDFRNPSSGVYFATVAVFADDFESGNTTAWSSTVP